MKMISLLLLLPLAGCSDNAMAEKGDFAAWDTSGEVDDDTSNIDSTGPTDEIHPAWYVVRAQLSVVEGLPSAEGAVVTIDVIDADLQRIDCVVELQTDGLVAGEVDVETELAWWDLPVRPVGEPCATLPSSLSLGVGQLHPDARARLGAVGHDAVADSLYGAWLRENAGASTVFGYAGTAADLAGADTYVFPPTDGVYQLAPLYVVALPEG